jgi:ubiquinone/menaquinone biosynthesis C-methylase UbiE
MLSAVAQRLGEIKGEASARAYMKIKEVDRILSLETVRSELIVLDVGGGLGLDDLLFAYKGAYSVVVDLNYEDLREGKRIGRDFDFQDRIDYLIADARKLPFTKEAFDVVTSFSAIEHLPCKNEFKAWIREMTRVLKNRGNFILTTSNRLWIMYPIAKLLMILKRRSPEIFFRPKEITVEMKQCNLDIKIFDARTVFYRGYSLIPLPRDVYEVLENLLNRLDNRLCLRIICGRMGFRAEKKFPCV